MLLPSKIASGKEHHEEIFLARYARLRAWALQLTENDRGLAEDLVHDVYIQFTLARPRLDAIDNLDGYLYTMLRNLHLSKVRRSLRRKHGSLSIVDYDSAELGLRAADPREQIRLQDELRQVCRYACARKETSKAGSVLILRFLHGYYPREIAQVMTATREAVEERLRVARSEAKQYLENPKGLRFMRGAPAEKEKASEAVYALTAEEFLSKLRQTVFDSCKGDCLTRAQMEKLYRNGQGASVDYSHLGHLVSCPRCLDDVNSLLGLPLLSERFPTDTLGTDTHKKGGGGEGGGPRGGGGGASPGPPERELRRCRKRARDVYEHRPTELCVSVNGYLMAAQKVGSELSEQTLTINVAEKIDFVEIFSEQDVRLLMVPVEELPAGGEYRRSARVELSDERTLEATLSFGAPWPTLQVVYSDPLLNAESAARSGAEESPAPGKLSPVARPLDESPDSEERARGRKLPSAWPRLSRWFTNTGFWLRPGTITAAVALVLIAALLVTRLHAPAASAVELLRRSAVADETAAADTEVVQHRTINLEERGSAGGDVISRRRVEVWQSAAHAVKVRRMYDGQGGLVAGEWTKADGTSTVYRRGLEPQARTSTAAAPGAVLETGELWRLDPSARDFAAIVGRAESLTVAEGPGTYVLNYSNDRTGGAAGRLLRATLVISKDGLRAVEQTLLVTGREGQAREFRFVETAFERKQARGLDPDLFKPEPELLGAAKQGKGGGESKQPEGAADGPAHSATATAAQPTEAVASPELEIEVTYLLNRIKANLGEQVSMTRTTGGALRVEALAETEGRKEEILRALGPIINNPAVRVEVSTVAEAVKRQQQGPSRRRDVREVEVADNRIPADAELRAYFSARLVGGEAVDEEIGRFAGRAMNRSRQALLRASALKSLVRRFSPEQINALAPEARAKWLGMIREHALGYRREVALLKQELRPVFGGGGEGASGEALNESALAQAADKLLQLSYANDEAVRSAFTISADGRTAAAIKSAQFWRSLAAAEKLAEAIERVYGK